MTEENAPEQWMKILQEIRDIAHGDIQCDATDDYDSPEIAIDRIGKLADELARIAAHAPSQQGPESDYDQKAVDVIQNLSMLVRRLCHRLNRHEPESKIVDQALGYLRGEGLQGSILRSEGKAQLQSTILPKFVSSTEKLVTKEEIGKGLERAQQIYEGWKLDELLLDQLYEAIVQANR